MTRAIEIPVGTRFGRLVTTSAAYSCNSREGRYVDTLCDCGAVLAVPVKKLRAAHTKSCGCLRDQLAREQMRRLHERQVPPVPVGTRGGRLVTIAEPYVQGGFRRVVVRCDCGNSLVVAAAHLLSGNTQSCGCLKGKGSRTHGLSGSAEYVVWRNMIDRCRYPGRPTSHRYVDRGIRVCERWETSFENFLADMGPRPEGVTSSGRALYEIDRIDNNRGYEPGNCRWTTHRQNMANATHCPTCTCLQAGQ